MKRSFKNIFIIIGLILINIIPVAAQDSGYLSYSLIDGTNNAPNSWFKDFDITVTPNTPIQINYNYNNSNMLIYTMENGQMASYVYASQWSGNVTVISSSTGKIYFDCTYNWDGINNYFLVDINYQRNPNYSINTQPTIINNNEYVTGKLGVGTTAPAATLDVNGSAYVGSLNNKLKIMEWSTGSGLWMDIPVVSGTPTGIGSGGKGMNPWIAYAGNTGHWFANASAGDLCYRNINGKLLFGNTVGNAAMAVKDNSVGIGTASPTQKLSVYDGNIAIKALGATVSDEAYNGALIITKPSASGQYINLIRQGQYPWSIGTIYNSSTFAIGYGKSSDADFISPFFNIDINGNVGIGTAHPDYLLTVNGSIHAKEVRVDITGSLADYVFDPAYPLMPLTEVERYVTSNKHLPEVPSATDVKNNGLSLGDMQNKLLQKIEELTLYLIEQQKQIEILKKKQK